MKITLEDFSRLQPGDRVIVQSWRYGSLHGYEPATVISISPLERGRMAWPYYIEFKYDDPRSGQHRKWCDYRDMCFHKLMLEPMLDEMSSPKQIANAVALSEKTINRIEFQKEADRQNLIWFWSRDKAATKDRGGPLDFPPEDLGYLRKWSGVVLGTSVDGLYTKILHTEEEINLWVKSEDVEAL